MEASTLAVRPWCQHTLEIDGHWSQPKRSSGRRRGRRVWQCRVLADARVERYRQSDNGKAVTLAATAAYRTSDRGKEVAEAYRASGQQAARVRKYRGTVKGADNASRRYYRDLSANIESNKAEVEAIQKRIRDAN